MKHKKCALTQNTHVNQESKGMTMVYKLIYIPQENTQIYPFCRLQLVDTQLYEITNQNSIKAPKAVKITNKKTLF